MQIKIKPMYKVEPNIKELNFVEPLFNGEDCYIVAGGPSLTNFDFNKLKDKNVIAINKAIFYVPITNKTILYFSDYRFYLFYKEELKKVNCLKYTITNKINKEDAIKLKDSGKLGIDIRNGFLKNGGNSGYAAINLAFHLKAKNIILLGYDMNMPNNKSHFHNGYKDKDPNVITNNYLYNTFMESFIGLEDFLVEYNINIYNTSMESSLSCISKVPLENFIK